MTKNSNEEYDALLENVTRAEKQRVKVVAREDVMLKFDKKLTSESLKITA